MNRKLQYIYNLFIAMIVSALAVSCTDDELVKGGDKYEVVPVHSCGTFAENKSGRSNGSSNPFGTV